MQDDARSVLAQVINTHGQDLVDDHRRLRSILADSLPGARREAQRLVAAAEEGIPRQILNSGADPTGALRLQLAKRLQEERDMTPEAADWTVDSWAGTLDIDLGGPAAGFPGEPTRTAPVPSDDDVPPPPARRGLWIQLAALAGLLVAVVLLVVVNPFRGTGGSGVVTPTPSPSATEEATTEPTATASPSEATETASPTPAPDAEDLLLARISPVIRDSCTTASWEIGEPVAQVNCETVGMDLVGYLQFATVDEMRAAYAEWVFADEEEGNCARGNVPAEHGWAVVGYTANELGRYSCFRGEGSAWIMWTTNYARILALGYREDGDFGELWNGWARREVRPLRGTGT